MPRAELTDGVRAGFERAAEHYDRYAVLEREVANRLFERLEFQRRTPQRILDLGCGTGHSTLALKRRYRGAEVIGLDIAFAMCRRAKARSGLLRPLRILCGDLGRLPLAGRSVDLVLANLAFQWQPDLVPVLHELRRVMRADGRLLFSCLGPGSMRELRTASSVVVPAVACQAFPDMHDIGDALLAAGFAEPVMDSETIVLDYAAMEDLLTELEGTGAAGHCTDWPAIRAAAMALERHWPRAAGHRLALSWEIVYGSAFGPAEGQPVRKAGFEEATFSVDALRQARRRP